MLVSSFNTKKTAQDKNIPQRVNLTFQIHSVYIEYTQERNAVSYWSIIKCVVQLVSGGFNLYMTTFPPTQAEAKASFNCTSAPGIKSFTHRWHEGTKGALTPPFRLVDDRSTL